MGFSLVAAAAALGVSTVIAMEILLGGLLPTIDDINTSYKEMNERMIEQAQTDIDIMTVSRWLNGTVYDYNITVENNGGITLKTQDFHLLINGTYYEHTCSRSYMYPENVAYFNITNVSATQAQRVKIVTPNGITDYYS